MPVDYVRNLPCKSINLLRSICEQHSFAWITCARMAVEDYYKLSCLRLARLCSPTLINYNRVIESSQRDKSKMRSPPMLANFQTTLIDDQLRGEAE